MKRKLISILIAAVIVFTLAAPVHTAADIALPVDESVGQYETITDVYGESQLTSVADECRILEYVDEKDFLSNDFKRRVEAEESLNLRESRRFRACWRTAAYPANPAGGSCPDYCPAAGWCKRYVRSEFYG